MDSTCFLLESHSRASALKRALLISWLDMVYVLLRGKSELLRLCTKREVAQLACIQDAVMAGLRGSKRARLVTYS